MGIATLEQPATEQQAPERYHWTVDSFYRAINAGVFDEPKRMELVHGDLWEKEKMNPPHASVTHRIARLLRKLFDENYVVREEKPVRLATDGEPMPDLCVARGDQDAFDERHPTQDDILLLIEVADATEDKDSGEKADLYAQAGITDYWVVKIRSKVVEVYRNPKMGKYPDPKTLRAGDAVSPLFAPGVSLPVSDLLPRPVEAA